MKNPGIFFALLGLAVFPPTAASTEGETESPASSGAKVVWVADEPTCPLTAGRVGTDIDSPDLYAFKNDGRVTEPVAIFKEHPTDLTEEQLDCYRNGIGLPVYQLTINRDGNVEEIVRVRDQPDCWTQVMVDIFQKWRFEPATRNGEPVCVAYIITMRFHPY